ncbi:Alpha-1A adrenergic receptor [Frankliniella fusca]|uniref:Alpha-1A adrenergic receptor n=1 Tax=Frankliniella fusca TaxID=407009 RepID=A0AAE1IWN9_9NEOP|nr:Alpha-1A adrenergic receptor [Frankliniella fusca]
MPTGRSNAPHITYHVVRRAIFSMWSLVLLLVSLPLFGFGLYYDPQERRCARYPHATKPVDVAYAYVYFTFGMLLIASILCCNLLVVRRLHHAGHASWGRVRARCRTIGAGAGPGPGPLSASGCYDGDPQPPRPRSRWALVRVLLLMRRGRPDVEEVEEAGEQAESQQQPPLIRRFSRSCQSRVRALHLQHSESVDSATHEETAFAKLMGFLCVLFVLCWLPQMIAIPITQLWPDWSPGKKFSRLADLSLLLHFTLDPFVYVLQSCTRRHHHKSVTPPAPAPAAPRHLPPHTPHTPGPGPGGGPGGGAVGHALAGAAATGAASAWPSSPAPAPGLDPQCQSYMRKLGSSLRLCGALAMCSCRSRSRSRGRRRQEGLPSDFNSRDLSLLQYHGNTSGITRSHHMPNSVAL